MWSCKACICKPTLAGALSGFIECSVCSHWFHLKCCKNISSDNISKFYTTSSSTDLLQSYVCSTCQADYVTTNTAESGGHYAHVSVESDPGGSATRDNPYAQDILIGL